MIFKNLMNKNLLTLFIFIIDFLRILNIFRKPLKK